VDTTMSAEKRIAPVNGACARTGETISGYEIHMGHTDGPDAERPFCLLSAAPDGAVNASGRVQGTYVHGAFASDPFRRAWLEEAGAEGAARLNYSAEVERAIDAMADGVEAASDTDSLLALAKSPGWRPVVA
ncbi:MAG: cobyric acid synthase CobQ, partial [Pseudomonadota bacterium]